MRSILIKSGPAGFTADKLKIVSHITRSIESKSQQSYKQFSNQSLDFDQVTSTDVTQEFDLTLSPSVVEYALRSILFFLARRLADDDENQSGEIPLRRLVDAILSFESWRRRDDEDILYRLQGGV